MQSFFSPSNDCVIDRVAASTKIFLAVSRIVAEPAVRALTQHFLQTRMTLAAPRQRRPESYVGLGGCMRRSSNSIRVRSTRGRTAVRQRVTANSQQSRQVVGPCYRRIGTTAAEHCVCVCVCVCATVRVCSVPEPRRAAVRLCAPVDVASLRLRHDRLLALRSAHSGPSQWVMTLL